MPILTEESKQLDRSYHPYTRRDFFHFPKVNGKEAIYLCGNSLGLMPKEAKKMLIEELEDWAHFGVEGHTQSRRPWLYYHHEFKKPLAHLVGADPEEVTAMNGLSVNLHLLMASFYKPTGKRTKILMEADAFPSDIYAVESQITWHGLDPKEHLVKMKPREGEVLLRKEDIITQIQALGDQLALVFFGGVNYYTGQFFPLQDMALAAHLAGALIGVDLAHAIGNVPLKLHDWGIDFAAWCSYKYLNSGPGSVSGIFVHETHGNNPDTFRLAGWWGHDEKERFKMEDEFKPIAGADGWQLSNAPVFAMAPHLASLHIFEQVGMENLREKSIALTSYLERRIEEELQPAMKNTPFKGISSISPKKPEERGCQLSLVIEQNGRHFFDVISSMGVIADWREPDVIRIAPVPLYNTFEDVDNFITCCLQALK